MNAPIYTLFMALFFITCGNDIDQNKNNKTENIEKSVNQNSVHSIEEFERIEVRFWNGYIARLHRLEYSQGDLQLFCDENNFKSKIRNKKQVDEFVALINQFYIEKSEEIILAKKKTDYITSSNYSWIEVNIFKNEHLLINKKTEIGSEIYDIEFNPEFLRLYDLIENLSKPCHK